MEDVPQSLVDECKLGNQDAYRELIEITHRQVFSLAFRLSGNRDDAAEITQETYFKVWRSIHQFRGDSKFSSWLYRVTSSAAISFLRKKTRSRLDVPLEFEEWRAVAAPAGTDPAKAAERSALRGRLEEALMELPVGYRTVVVMKDVYGFSLEEIGRELDITSGAAKVRLFRARQRLRDMLTGETGEPPIER